MLRSDVARRLKNFKSIQKELRPEILDLLKQKSDDVLSMEEILYDLHLTESGIRGKWCSPPFGPDVYCGDPEDVFYCAGLVVDKLVASGLAEKIMIGRKAYYGLRKRGGMRSKKQS